jgi:hypothetical protein
MVRSKNVRDFFEKFDNQLDCFERVYFSCDEDFAQTYNRNSKRITGEYRLGEPGWEAIATSGVYFDPELVTGSIYNPKDMSLEKTLF